MRPAVPSIDLDAVTLNHVLSSPEPKHFTTCPTRLCAKLALSLNRMAADHSAADRRQLAHCCWDVSLMPEGQEATGETAAAAGGRLLTGVNICQPWCCFAPSKHGSQVLLAPAGVVACFRPLTDASLFLLLYGVTAVYFSGVMVRRLSAERALFPMWLRCWPEAFGGVIETGQCPLPTE